MGERITKSIIVKGDISEIYDLWSEIENFPQFMKNIKSVNKMTEEVSHWVMEGPFGKDLEWDARITHREENVRIAWQTVDGDLRVSGQVTFKELPHAQTEITLTMHYEAPAGKLGEFVGNLFDDPEDRVEEDLLNFKHFAEGMTERIQQKEQKPLS